MDFVWNILKEWKKEAGLTDEEVMRFSISWDDNPKYITLSNVLNCPNCGAPIKRSKCEYCGTVFKQEDDDDYAILYANNKPVMILRRKECGRD